MKLEAMTLIIDEKEYVVLSEFDIEGHKYVYLFNKYKPADAMFREIIDEKVAMINPEVFKNKVLPKFIEILKERENN